MNATAEVDDDDKTIVTSNQTQDLSRVLKGQANTSMTIAATARQLFGAPNPQYLNAIAITASQAIADTGATSIFIIEGTPCKNICPAIRPLTINLPDGTKVMSTHTRNITIPGLPKVLVGHVVTKFSIASLIRIKVLCGAGYKVLFTKTKCEVRYTRHIILNGSKDPSTDLWMLPIDTGSEHITKTIKKPTDTPTRAVSPPPQRSKNRLPSDAHDGATHVANFTHSVKTRANTVRFAHQSLCNPKMLTLL